MQFCEVRVMWKTTCWIWCSSCWAMAATPVSAMNRVRRCCTGPSTSQVKANPSQVCHPEKVRHTNNACMCVYACMCACESNALCKTSGEPKIFSVEGKKKLSTARRILGTTISPTGEHYQILGRSEKGGKTFPVREASILGAVLLPPSQQQIRTIHSLPIIAFEWSAKKKQKQPN